MTEKELQQKIDDSENEIEVLKKKVEKIEREIKQYLKVSSLFFFLFSISHYLIPILFTLFA